MTFQAASFNTTEQDDHFLNPGNFGDDLCQWLMEKLRSDGIQCDEKPDQEDFGWYFNFRLGEKRYCVVCGYRPASEEDPGLWIAWIERHAGFISSIFGGRDKDIDPEAPRLVHRLLSGSQELSGINWYYKKDFESGGEGRASPTPD